MWKEQEPCKQPWTFWNRIDIKICEGKGWWFNFHETLYIAKVKFLTMHILHTVALPNLSMFYSVLLVCLAEIVFHARQTSEQQWNSKETNQNFYTPSGNYPPLITSYHVSLNSTLQVLIDSCVRIVLGTLHRAVHWRTFLCDHQVTMHLSFNPLYWLWQCLLSRLFMP